MYFRQSHVPHLAALVIFHAAGAGLAFPSILGSRPEAKTEWLPRDNQTVYRIEAGKGRRLELNTSSITETPVFISVSPCFGEVHWAVYRGIIWDGHYRFSENQSGSDSSTIAILVKTHERIILQLSSALGGGVAVSVRGEKPKFSRLRLRVRSRRRLMALWEPSPIDPQATSYCVVASQKKNYTSLCAAQYDLRTSIQGHSGRVQKTKAKNSSFQTDEDNSVETNESFGAYSWDLKSGYKRRKFSRSTRVSENGPVIACVGDRTHHIIENLDPGTTYFVSVFGVAQDRRAGSLLAAGTVRPRTTVAKRLRENLPFRTEIRGKTVLYYKATVNPGGGMWLSAAVCGGPVDLEVSIRGQRLYAAKNIEQYKSIFVPAPAESNYLQETSEEGSIQYDSSSSSSEESKVRFVVKVTPSKRERDSGIGLELTARTVKSPPALPELSDEASTVRELRPQRSCRSVDVAHLPVPQNGGDFIRYCVSVHEIAPGAIRGCSSSKLSGRTQCTNYSNRIQSKVIVHKINNLKPGRRYEVYVTASDGSHSVSYKMIHVSTSLICARL